MPADRPIFSRSAGKIAGLSGRRGRCALALVLAAGLLAGLFAGMAQAVGAEPVALQEIGRDELRAREGVADARLIPPRSMHERVFRMPVDSRGTRLIVTVLTPDGPGPFPLAVINHGADGNQTPPALQIRYRRSLAADYFLSRGYAVVLPMMRGFAGSDGEQGHFGCDLARLGRSNARDIAAVIDSVARWPGIDASRIVVAGQSFGGWNTLAVGALDHAGVVGLVNFNGGVKSSGCKDGDRALIANARDFAASTRVPSLWVYGQTDRLFPPALWHALHDAYVGQGGQADLVDIGAFFTDSHRLLSYPEALGAWVPRVDAFLARLKMPHSPVFADYLPGRWPDPSGYAAIDDIAKVPYLTSAGIALYRRFLAHDLPRALAISPKGDVSAAYGGFDQAVEAVKSCGGTTGHACRLYALDNDVVWQPLPAAPPPSHYAALGDVGALPVPGPAKFTFYPQFLARPSPRALVLGTDGRGYGVYGDHAFEQALVNCQAVSAGCAAYVVNDAVVWAAAANQP